MRRLFAILLTIPLLIATGCGSNGSAPSAKFATSNANPKPNLPKEVSLADGSITDVERAIKENEKSVVLVEFWTIAAEPSSDLGFAMSTRGGIQQVKGATLAKDKVAWSGIRKAQYLAHKYEGYFLKVIAVNVDGPGKKEDVLKFLQEKDAKHVINFSLTGDPATAKDAFGYAGKAPHQVVYARNGKKVWTTGDPLTTTLDDLLFTELDK